MRAQRHWKAGGEGTLLKGKTLERATPVFREFLKAGSGHPSSDIYGWVGNGTVNLNVANEYQEKSSFGGFAGVRYPVAELFS